MKKTDKKVIVSVILDEKPSVVWEVLTQLKHMKNWFFEEIVEFEAEVGFKTSFIVHVGERSFDHLWRIVSVVEGKEITYNWKYNGYAGDSLVHFELRPEAEKIEVRLTTEILEDFPQDIPEFKIESCQSGWNYFICESLPKYIASLNS